MHFIVTCSSYQVLVTMSSEFPRTRIIPIRASSEVDHMRTGGFFYSLAMDSLGSSTHAYTPGGLFNLQSSKRHPSTKTTGNGLCDIRKRTQYSETNTFNLNTLRSFLFYSISLRPCRKIFGHHRNIVIL